MPKTHLHPVWARLLIPVLLAVPVGAATSKPNILLVLSDDHSVPHLGCYGSRNAITPNLDAFAAQGMRFERAYTTSPQCAPSRGSIFAGRSPVSLDITRFAQPAARQTVFFTDVLRQHGYWVGIDGRHHHLDGKRKEEAHVEAAFREAGLRYLEEKFDHVRILSSKGGNLAKIAGWFNEAIDKVPPGKPFFLYYGLNQPHRPWNDRIPGVTFDPARLELPPDYPDLPEVRADYAMFLHEVHVLDRAFGALMDALAKRGLAKNTIVVFMGDNGESLLRGKGTLYDRGTHVPLIVRWPGTVKVGTTSDGLVSGQDLAATLLDAVGLPVPPVMTSVSFLPALKGQPYSGRDYVFAERGWHHGPITRTDGFDLSRSIASRRYRFIYNVLPDRAYLPVDMPGTAAWRALVRAHEANALSPLHRRLLFQKPRPIFELYDLQADPYELTNLAGQRTTEAVETTLRNELAKWMVREGDFLPLPSLKYPVE